MSALRAIALTILKLVYLSPFVIFGFWLVMHAYFPSVVEDRPTGPPPKEAPPEADHFADEEGMFGTLLRPEIPITRRHFHMFDTYLQKPEPGHSLCIQCHGIYPHYADEKSRGFLNLHGGFMDCAVCHLGRQEGRVFGWVDRVTDQVVPRVEGKYGKYPAKIFPVWPNAKGQVEVVRPVTVADAKAYLAARRTFTPEQNEEAKHKLHDHIADEALGCEDCHTERGALDFAGLGFSKVRVAELTSSEVAGMVGKYDTFYMPSMLGLGRDRQEPPAP